YILEFGVCHVVEYPHVRESGAGLLLIVPVYPQCVVHVVYVPDERLQPIHVPTYNTRVYNGLIPVLMVEVLQYGGGMVVLYPRVIPYCTRLFACIQVMCVYCPRVP